MSIEKCLLFFVVSFGLITNVWGSEQGEDKGEKAILVVLPSGDKRPLKKRFVPIWKSITEMYGIEEKHVINTISLNAWPYGRKRWEKDKSCRPVNMPYIDMEPKTWWMCKDSGKTNLDKARLKYGLLSFFSSLIVCSGFMYSSFYTGQRNHYEAEPSPLGVLAACTTIIAPFLSISYANWHYYTDWKTKCYPQGQEKRPKNLEFYQKLDNDKFRIIITGFIKGVRSENKKRAYGSDCIKYWKSKAYSNGG